MIRLQLPLALTFLVISQVSWALTLNGIGSYQQLRKEFYIGALYLSQPSSNPQDILKSTGSKRMALKVTTKRWSPRRWSLQWQNDIAINNPFSSDKELTRQLLEFTGFLQDNLRSGDEILVDYVPAKGTTVSINGVTVLQTKTHEFFKYLVNVWIGKLPPSGEFKTNILSEAPNPEQDTLLTRYNSLSYDDGRSKEIEGWIQSKRQAIIDEENRIKAERAAAQKKAKAEREAKQLAAAQAKKAKQAPEKKAESKPTYVKPKPAKKKKVITQKKKVDAGATTSTAKTQAEKAAENKYYLKLYEWELNREIRNAVEYPEWAKNFGQKGTVELKFDVNRKAEVSNVKGDNEDVSVLLVSELHRAILEVVPFILPPDSLKGNGWTLSAKYVFDPKTDDQPYSKKPSKPASLQSNKKISRAEYNRVLSNYLDDVKDIITSSIEYPVWAKKLNQKGKVKIEIKIDKEGNVIDQKDIALSRHETLNQEVRNAIESNQPLPIIPEALKLNYTKTVIEYSFQ